MFAQDIRKSYNVEKFTKVKSPTDVSTSQQPRAFRVTWFVRLGIPGLFLLPNTVLCQDPGADLNRESTSTHKSSSRGQRKRHSRILFNEKKRHTRSALCLAALTYAGLQSKPTHRFQANPGQL